MNTGDKIKEIRLSAGLTQSEVASKCNVDRLYITLIETNRRKPKIDLLSKIAKCLNCSVSDIIEINIQK